MGRLRSYLPLTFQTSSVGSVVIVLDIPRIHSNRRRVASPEQAGGQL